MSLPAALTTVVVLALVTSGLLWGISVFARRYRATRLAASPRREADGTWYFQRHLPSEHGLESAESIGPF